MRRDLQRRRWRFGDCYRTDLTLSPLTSKLRHPFTKYRAYCVRFYCNYLRFQAQPSLTQYTVSSRFLLFSFLWLFLSIPDGLAQTFTKISESPAYDDYALVNDSLSIGHWYEVLIPYGRSNAGYLILEQETRPVRPTTATPDGLLSSDIGIPIAEVVNPGVYQKQRVASLRLHTARLTSQPDVVLVTRRLVVRVFKETVWADGVRMRGDATGYAIPSGPTPIATGTWYKIPITRSGIHILDRAYLQSLGINMATVNQANIQIWGTNGLQMPKRNNIARSPFQQIPVRINGDALYFYANGPNDVRYNASTQRFSQHIHPYTTTSYVFVTVGSTPGLRLNVANTEGSVSEEVTTFLDFRWKEMEQRKPYNRLKSGQQWLGQQFTPETFARTQSILVDTLDGFVQGSTIRVEGMFAARSTTSSTFSVSYSGGSIGNVFVGQISNIDASTALAASTGSLNRDVTNVTLANDIIEITATFNNTNSAALGWLDWVRVTATRLLKARNGHLRFYSPINGDGSMVHYRLTGLTGSPMVLDITNPQSPLLLQSSQSGSDYLVRHTNLAGRTIVAQTIFIRPGAGVIVPNQDIRSTSFDPDYLVITSPELLEAANELANRRESQGWRPLVVTQAQIFNEFNGGIPDLIAMRDFVRYFYDRAGTDVNRMPKHLLLFGDTTYDYKGIMSSDPLRNQVFTFQSEESLSKINTYGSDDYFGFLDLNEGEWTPVGDPIPSFERLDIGVGRLPVQTMAEARTVIRKIEAYENPELYGDWRSLVTFTSDDNVNGSNTNEGDLHVYNADGTIERVPLDDTGVRVNKIYQISYPIVNSPLGRVSPEANRAFVNAINNGTLLVNYAGHGSETLLSAEGLFRSDDVTRLNNLEKLTILITVTCEFGRYDDTESQSGAELLILHPQGGAIASYTTSRVVFTSSSPDSYNFGLNIQLTLAMLSHGADGKPKTFGDIYKETKNTSVGATFNSRKFVLLGDPAMRIGLPESQIRLTSINGVVPGTGNIQLRALDQASIEGDVVLNDGTVNTAFNGQATIKVYDATRYVPMTQLTNCNIQNCAYGVQNDVVFSGKVSVANGRFSSTFIIPRDISYSDSTGRVVMYAADLSSDAAGSFSNLILNGRNPNALDDGAGPNVSVYLNDTDYMDGGIVNENPTLIVDITDPSGINTAGAGVGHELIAILRSRPLVGPERTFMLNEFYESALNDYTTGRVTYPLQDLEPGTYELTVRAWDVFNNPGETTTTFTVAEQQNLSIRNVYNYPNPTSGYTRFIFEHNQAGNTLDVMIRVFTLSGKPVAQLRDRSLSVSGGLASLEWDGTDADGNRLASGTYLYHVRVATDTDTRETVEKLVIIR